MRKVTVHTVGTGVGKKVETSATNWAELQKDLSKAGVNYNGMKVIDASTRNTLEHPDAKIGEGDINVFLYPVKTKSGLTAKQVNAMSYTEVKAAIKEAIANHPNAGKEHFSADKSWTTKSSDVNRENLISYKAPKKPEAAPKAVAKVAKVTKKDTKAIAPAKESKEVAAPKKSAKDAAKSVAKEVVKSPSKAVETAIDVNALDKEAREIARGLTGIK